MLTSGTESEKSVLRKMERDARVQGPARAFVLEVDGIRIEGVVKRRYLQMKFDSALPENKVNELKSFFRSLLPDVDELVIEDL